MCAYTKCYKTCTFLQLSVRRCRVELSVVNVIDKLFVVRCVSVWDRITTITKRGHYAGS